MYGLQVLATAAADVSTPQPTDHVSVEMVYTYMSSDEIAEFVP